MTYPQSKLTRPIRRAIMIFLIINFFLISPATILYTAGYRYDWKTGQIKQTGVISIDAEPRDAQVFLNNVQIKNRMPIRLTNRAPGTYRLKIEMPGYKNWEKDITVESKQTTYIKDVTLFKEALPIQIFDKTADNISQIYPSPNGKYSMILVEKNGIYEVDLVENGNDTHTSILRTKTDLKPDIAWSPFENFVLVKNEYDNKIEINIFNASNPDIGKTYTYPASNTTISYQWQKNTIIPSLYLKRGATISQITTNAERVIKYLPQADLWFVDDKENFWIYNQTDKKISQTDNETISITLTEATTKIIDINENRAILQTANKMQIVDIKDIKNPKTVSLFTQSLQYNQTVREWLTWSNSELWTIYEDGGTNLLNRTSEQIKFIRPLDEQGNFLIATPNSILAFNPGYYVTHELFSSGSIEQITANKKTRKLYFLGRVGNREGLFELEY